MFIFFLKSIQRSKYLSAKATTNQHTSVIILFNVYVLLQPINKYLPQLQQAHQQAGVQATDTLCGPEQSGNC